MLAWLFLGEKPGVLAIAGLLVASAGCFLIGAAQAATR
jgi:drug/metabolite transporter (DMT)-like permease